MVVNTTECRMPALLWEKKGKQKPYSNQSPGQDDYDYETNLIDGGRGEIHYSMNRVPLVTCIWWLGIFVSGIFWYVRNRVYIGFHICRVSFC